jgi:hypothetical protein
MFKYLGIWRFNLNFRRKIIIYLDEKSPNLLTILCDKYGSDKGSYNLKSPYFNWTAHTYTYFYIRRFESIRETVKNVFELGIGTNNPEIPSSMGINGMPGASLRVWKDYFPNAKIFGADIDAGTMFEEERISTFIVDQLDKNSISDMFNKIGVSDFDIMIDDGLHTFSAGITLFSQGIKHLKKNGIYVIEDINFYDLPKFKSFFNHTEFVVDYIHFSGRGGVIAKPDNFLIVITKP